MKMLVLCLGSYKIKDATGADLTNIDRQTLYAIALSRLIEIKPANAEIVVAENTVSDISELHPVLQNQLKRPEVSQVVLVKDNELGAKNKGAGEYMMCQSAVKEAKELFSEVDWVVYFTSRYPLFSNLIFHYLEGYADKDAIVANADYLYPNGKVIKSAAGHFNDVIFAMKRDWFLRYINSMSPEELTRRKMSSEQNLYNFVIASRLNFKEVYRWGLARYNYAIFETEVI